MNGDKDTENICLQPGLKISKEEWWPVGLLDAVIYEHNVEAFSTLQESLNIENLDSLGIYLAAPAGVQFHILPGGTVIWPYPEIAIIVVFGSGD